MDHRNPVGGAGMNITNPLATTRSQTMKRIYSVVAAAILALASFASVPVYAGALTDFAENKVIDATLRAQAIGTPATWYIALYTACPTDNTAGTEVAGGGYARAAVAAGLANWAGTQAAGSTTASSGTGGTTSNNAAISFPTPTASWGTVVCWGITDALTAGNVWIYSALTVSKTINIDDAVSFGIGAATFQIDN